MRVVRVTFSDHICTFVKRELFRMCVADQLELIQACYLAEVTAEFGIVELLGGDVWR